MPRKVSQRITLTEYDAYYAARRSNILHPGRNIAPQVATRLNISNDAAGKIIKTIERTARFMGIAPDNRCLSLLDKLGCLNPKGSTRAMHLRGRAIQQLTNVIHNGLFQLPPKAREHLIAFFPKKKSYNPYLYEPNPGRRRNLLEIPPPPPKLTHIPEEQVYLALLGTNEQKDPHWRYGGISGLLAESLDIDMIIEEFRKYDSAYGTIGREYMGPQVGQEIIRQLIVLCDDLGCGDMIDPEARKKLMPATNIQTSFRAAAQVLFSEKFTANEAAAILHEKALAAIAEIFKKPEKEIKPEAAPDRLEAGQLQIRNQMKKELVDSLLRKGAAP